MSDREWVIFSASARDDKERTKLLAANNEGHPDFVHPSECLRYNLLALQCFFDQDQPIKVCVWFCKCVQAVIRICDSSKSGFGDSFSSNKGISYCFGIWTAQIMDESSNFREFKNCIDAIRREGEVGHLEDTLLLFCTNNTIIEQAIYKGTTSSPKLLEMVIKFYNIQFEFGFTSIITHVSGTRMIAQGGYRLSCGATNKGVLCSEEFISFLPLHKTTINRSPSLQEWILEWIVTSEPIFLQPED